MKTILIRYYSVATRCVRVYRKTYRFGWMAKISAALWRTSHLPGFVILSVELEKQ